jgi:hypothetical protein
MATREESRKKRRAEADSGSGSGSGNEEKRAQAHQAQINTLTQAQLRNILAELLNSMNKDSLSGNRPNLSLFQAELHSF